MDQGKLFIFVCLLLPSAPPFLLPVFNFVYLKFLTLGLVMGHG
jgi:hypothetical protein